MYICPLLCWQGQCRFTEHGGASPVDVREEVVCPFFVHRLRSDRNYTERSQERMRDSIFFFSFLRPQDKIALPPHGADGITKRETGLKCIYAEPRQWACQRASAWISGFCTRCSTSRERKRNRESRVRWRVQSLIFNHEKKKKFPKMNGMHVRDSLLYI